ncbi:hypothetical protein [Dinghuibacter silviterrae]|nr:hypothetical protein [Dinghuibacter silviterrae]
MRSSVFIRRAKSAVWGAAALWTVAASCTSAYRGLKPASGDPACIQRFKPALGTALYKTEVDADNHPLSGLLVLKAMPDSSTRVVFTSETGLTFFDFAFAADGTFTVHHIIDQMNKKALIKTLRKDFELVLLKHTTQGRVLTKGHELFYAFPQEKGTNYYITDSACTRLDRIEKASKRRAVVTAWMMDYREGVPDSVSIVHHIKLLVKKIPFTIALKRIPS